MRLEKDIFWFQVIAREVSLPLWCFLVAKDIRKPVEYPDLDLPWFKENKIYLGHLGGESEEYYALRKRLESLLLPLAEAAATEAEFSFVLKHCDTFDFNIQEIIWAKKRKLDEPEHFRLHERSLKSENARRLTAIELSETEEELWSFVNGVMAEMPRFDTATEKAVKKMLTITTKLSTLKSLYDSYLHTQVDWRFDIARRIIELKNDSLLEV
jgi:hypothetical protein